MIDFNKKKLMCVSDLSIWIEEEGDWATIVIID